MHAKTLLSGIISSRGDRGMVSCIRVLSEETINQIAAGEVIENPASVVKELVENSLDAKASHVHIEVASGGFQLIRISDDGVGMSQDDAVLSLERYATSKVRVIDDVFSIRSMGFRGEALASIAAISKLTMITSLKEGAYQGTKVVSEGGKLKAIEPCPRKPGTTLEIRSLFYTVPARKKFQKSPPQALADIHKMVISLSLSRPDIAFTLIADEKVVLETAATDLLTRVADVLGKDYCNSVVPIDYREESIAIRGVIAKPNITRSNRSGQHLFINQRGITSGEVSLAVADGYGTMLEARKHPLFILHIELASQDLDVNVHPQKKQVRFKQEDLIKGSIRRGVAQTLQKKEVMKITPSYPEVVQSKAECLFERSHDMRQDVKLLKQQIVKDLLPWEEATLPEVFDVNILGLHRKHAFIEASSIQDKITLPGVVKGCDGLVVIDLRACSARIYFDKVMSRVSSENVEWERQTLLFPIKLELSFIHSSIMEECEQYLQALGICVRAFGERTWVVEACDSCFDEEQLKDWIMEFIEEASGVEPKKMIEKYVLKTSQLILRGKRRYTVEEAKELVKGVLKASNPYRCPSGKKTMVYLGEQDYDKLFS